MADGGSDSTRELCTTSDSGERGPALREPAATATELAPGSRIDRYEVVKQLGRGGMGVVYAAVDTALGRRVALKLVRPDRSGGRDDATRLLREGQALASLSHRNVVAVHDVGTIGDQMFIAMELVEGGNLAAWIDREPRAVHRILEVLVAAGRGLAAAHDAGIVHRDFKPENVLIGDGGDVRVTDFGVARLAGGAAPPAGEAETLAVDMTRSGALVGTPAYMAPEQFDRGEVTAAADQFAFCVTAYEMLHGVRPFAGTTVSALRAAIGAQKLVAPGRPARVPRRVRDAIVRGLAVDPAARHPSMHALVASLEPRGHRRWMAAGAGAMVIAAAASTVVVLGRGAPAAVDPCDGEDRLLDAMWNPVRAGQIRGALRRTGAPYAAQAGTAATEAFDRWAGEWHALRHQTCVASQIEHTLAPEVAAARIRCLDEQKLGVAEKLDALANADAAIAPIARELATAGPASRCARAVGTGAGAGAGSSDPAVQALLIERAQASVLLQRGKFKEALARYRALLPRAQAAARPELTAVVEIELANALLKNGELAEALALAHRGVQGAAAYGRDAEAADGWRTIVYAKAGLRDRNGLDETITAARSAALRTGSPSAQVLMIVAVAALLQRAERIDDGLAACEEARQLAERELSTSDLVRARPHSCASVMLASQGRFADALVHAREVTAVDERVLGADHPTTGDSLAMQAKMLAQLGQVAESLAMRRRAHRILERNFPESYDDLWDSYHGIGMTLGRSEERADRVEGQALIEKALALAEKYQGADSRLAAIYRGSLGQILATLDQREAALDHYARAVAVLAKTAPDGFEIRMNRLNWAGLLAEAERCAEALPIFADAVAGSTREDFRLAATIGRAVCLLDGRRAAAALAELDALITAGDATDPSPENLARLTALRGEALLALRRRAEARVALTMARAQFVAAEGDFTTELASIEELLVAADRE